MRDRRIIYAILIIVLVIVIFFFCRCWRLFEGFGGKRTKEVVQEVKTEEQIQEEEIPPGEELKYRLIKGYESVQMGMSKKDVEYLMGEPDEASYQFSDEFGNVEVWAYVSVDINYAITFKNGRVVKKQKG